MIRGGRGFSTVELMIALALASIVISAVAVVGFGEQSSGASAQNAEAALREAEDRLSEMQRLSRQDFNLVNATTSIRSGFSESVSVVQKNFTQKEVIASIEWGSVHPLSIELSMLVPNFENLQAPDTCDSSVGNIGAWKHPSIRTYDFGALVLGGLPLSGFSLSGLDAFFGKLYVTADAAPVANRNTFFIFDISNPMTAPTLLGNLDNDPAVAAGLKGVAVASTSQGIFAFLASASSFARGQLQVVGIGDAAHPQLVATYKMPLLSVPSAGFGNAVLYKDGYVYLGLTSTSAGGDEFNVVDVHDPPHPAWAGGYSLVGHDVNAIAVKGSRAYIVHPLDFSADQLSILDISNPGNPSRAGGFAYADGGFANGKSITVVGANVYFGRTASNIAHAADGIPELFLLDASRLSPPSIVGSVALATGDSVNGIIVRGDLLFVLTNTQLQVWNAADASHPVPWTPDGTTNAFIALPGGKGIALACEGDTLYMISRGKTGASDILSVITAGS